MAEAYSHEVSSCGFWPGNGGYGRAAFYVYAYPEPAGYGETRLSTTEVFYDTGLGQFILPYDAVHQSAEPDKVLYQLSLNLTPGSRFPRCRPCDSIPREQE
jgi:hypothetical protein